MPLKAIIDNQEIIAPLLSDEQWNALRNDKNCEIMLPCCHASAYPRVSKLGTRHFVHKDKSECTDGGETSQHLLGKELALRGCKDAGWDVDTEVSGEDWRADVLAKKDNNKVAIEIQFSRQTYEETKLRQERYKNAGIRCAWLFNKLPRSNDNPVQKEIPMFPVDWNEKNNPKVDSMDLRTFVRELMSGHYSYRSKLVLQSPVIVIVSIMGMICWKCNRPINFFRKSGLKPPVIDIHGNEHETQFLFIDDSIVYSKSILDALYHFLQTPKGSQFHIGRIKKRYSRTEGCSYLSQGCPYCDALLGDFFIFHDYYHYSEEYQLYVSLLEEDSRTIAKTHWCHSPEKHFCPN